MELILTPFSALLLFLYEFLNSYGLALIVFSLVVKVILFYFSLKGKKSMIQMNMLQGKDAADSKTVRQGQGPV